MSISPVFAASALTIWLAVGLSAEPGRATKPGPEPAPSAVEVAAPASGTFSPVDPVLVVAPSAGRIDDLYVADGARVQAGALLAAIDDGTQIVQVRAPIAGIVQHTETSLGSTVRDHKSPMFTLTRTRDVLRLGIDLVAPVGAHVTVFVPDQPNRSFEGVVVRSDDGHALIDVSDPAHHLRPGLTGTATLNAAF